MKFALVQPNWEFRGSTYFGCAETHLPLELLYARQQLQAAGHETLLLDAQLEGLGPEAAGGRMAGFAPDFLVMTTAPTYLFWRCPQPELRVPAEWMQQLRRRLPASAVTVAIGPHGSATPRATLAKLDCEVVMQGEAEQALPQLAAMPWNRVPGCAFRSGKEVVMPPGAAAADLAALPALEWSDYPLHLRQHRHHVFSGSGRGAEVEASRGCPWACTFCNKTLFRNRFRQRPLAAVLEEIEGLVRHGIGYVYFIDEIFGCGRQTPELLAELEGLPIEFGMQTRIDLWNEDTLAALGRAGCISLECGIESVTAAGRARMHKGCRLDRGEAGAGEAEAGTERIRRLLQQARRHIAWVQANLIAEEGDSDDAEAIAAWRRDLIAQGVWASQPVPVFAYPGTPLYQSMFGAPDDAAWERAHRHYLQVNRERGRYSDIQDPAPQTLEALEAGL